jgi:hypothetical protein
MINDSTSICDLSLPGPESAGILPGRGLCAPLRQTRLQMLTTCRCRVRQSWMRSSPPSGGCRVYSAATWAATSRSGRCDRSDRCPGLRRRCSSTACARREPRRSRSGQPSRARPSGPSDHTQQRPAPEGCGAFVCPESAQRRAVVILRAAAVGELEHSQPRHAVPLEHRQSVGEG